MNDYLENADTRVVALGLVAIVVLLLAVQFMYLLLPQYKDWTKLQSSYDVLQQATSSQLNLENQLAQTNEQLKDLSFELHGDMGDLPENQMESYIVGRLQRISWESDVELRSVIPGNGERLQQFQEILFDVQVQGQYFDFFEWLQAVNQQLGYIVVRRFDIVRIGNPADKRPTLQINLTLVAYRMVRDA